MTTALADVPPPFEPTNAINLTSVEDSKILKVSLYSGLAEITRLYKFSVRTGQNQVNINGLPNVLDCDSIRVEGRGNATIHDVTLSDIPKAPDTTTSEVLLNLNAEKELATKALARANKGKKSLEAYLSTLNVQYTDVDVVDKVLDHYDTRGDVLDRRISELDEKLVKLEKQIKEEQEKVVKEAGTGKNDKLGVRATIGVFAAEEGEVAIALIYAVASATWKATYDIRVDMQTKEKKFVNLIYKAGISQNTGESWDNVNLSLETATPTFGLGIPTLPSWTLSPHQPPRWRELKKAKNSTLAISSGANRRATMLSSRGEGWGEPKSWALSQTSTVEGSESDEEMGHMGLDVTSKGDVTATFQVPGDITIPSDGNPHKVTVTQLELEAEMSWVAVPKVDAGKVHLKAKVKNASEYTLLPGVANVYVDGSFISKSNVPLVSPQENFDCPLGLDPSIRITYHPLTKSVSHQSNFVSRSTTTQTFSQSITVHNTKSTIIHNLKVCEQYPVSQDSQIVVKYLNPQLVMPADPLASGSSAAVSTKEDNAKALAPIKVQGGVTAQWEGAEAGTQDFATMELPGRDGRFGFACTVPSMGKLMLTVAWEVTAPLKMRIEGI